MYLVLFSQYFTSRFYLVGHFGLWVLSFSYKLIWIKTPLLIKKKWNIIIKFCEIIGISYAVSVYNIVSTGVLI